MSEGVAPGRPPEGGPIHWSRRFPFWVMQATEIVVALMFVDISIHVAHGDLLVVGGAGHGGAGHHRPRPAGIVRVCGQRLHLLLASVLAGLWPWPRSSRLCVRTSRGSSSSNSGPSDCSVWPP